MKPDEEKKRIPRAEEPEGVIRYYDAVRVDRISLRLSDVHGGVLDGYAYDIFFSRYHKDPGVIGRIGSFRIPAVRRYNRDRDTGQPKWDEAGFEDQVQDAIIRWAKEEIT